MSPVAASGRLGHNGPMTEPTGSAGTAELVAPLDAAVALGDVAAITARCRVLVPGPDGRHREEARRLSYHG